MIAESGLTLADVNPVMPQAVLQENGVRWAQQKGTPDLAILRALSSNQLIQSRDAPIQFGPAVDGYILNATPTTVAQAGGLADVPVLTGYNAAEGTVPLDAAITEEELSSKLGTLDALERPFYAIDRRISDQLTGYWLNFIQTGNPNGSGLPAWRSFSAGSTDIMHLSATPAMLPIVAPAKAEFLTRAIGTSP